MVRDRVCNTFVARSSALVHGDAEGEHFFCSDSCRNRFLAAAPDPGRPEGPTARN
jgi:YHS domain-containing protein